MGGMTILALQKFLTQRGCNPGPLDSGLGKQTVVALQKFLSLQPDVLELKAVRRKKKGKAKTGDSSAASAPKAKPKAKSAHSKDIIGAEMRRLAEEASMMDGF